MANDLCLDSLLNDINDAFNMPDHAFILNRSVSIDDEGEEMPCFTLGGVDGSAPGSRNFSGKSRLADEELDNLLDSLRDGIVEAPTQIIKTPVSVFTGTMVIMAYWY